MKDVILSIFLSIYLSIYLSISLSLSIRVYKWADIGYVQRVFVGYIFIVRYTLLGIGFDDKDYLITLVDTWFVFWR